MKQETCSQTKPGWPLQLATLTREIFLKTSPGVRLGAATFYTKPWGGDLISIHSLQTESDLCDAVYIRHSNDNGRNWSHPDERSTCEVRENGTLRRSFIGGYCDPYTGRFLVFRNESLLPSDNCLEALQENYLSYEVSLDGGRSFSVDEQIICEGACYDTRHPLPGVWIGRNSVMLGDMGCQPLALSDKILLLPCSITPLEAPQSLINTTSYQISAVLRGTWRDGERLQWELSAPMQLAPSLSTRGAFEPTLGQLADGRVLCVLRGSNDGNPKLAGYRWASVSADEGLTWSEVRPWTDTLGRSLFSPSSCSQLVRHSSGRLLWFGNLTSRTPMGNTPRYPLVYGEVELSSGLLRHDSIQIVDDRNPDESEDLMLSNFYVREDRETGQLVLHLTRLFERGSIDPDTGRENWTANASLYRITL